MERVGGRERERWHEVQNMLKVIITYKCVWEIERDIERVTEKDIARDRDRHRHRERERERERETERLKDTEKKT